VNETALVTMRMRPDAGFYFVRTGIGRALRTLYSDVLSEAIPERMAELLKQIDQPAKDGQDADKT
jgi:hypothetical protein